MWPVSQICMVRDLYWQYPAKLKSYVKNIVSQSTSGKVIIFVRVKKTLYVGHIWVESTQTTGSVFHDLIFKGNLDDLSSSKFLLPAQTSCFNYGNLSCPDTSTFSIKRSSFLTIFWCINIIFFPDSIFWLFFKYFLYSNSKVSIIILTSKGTYLVF